MMMLLLALLVSCSLSGVSLHASAPNRLPPYYRKWIDEDVTYIITQNERHEFLKLQTDDERDAYIQQFWESRNPTPHSLTNSFKEEHYRRLAYVRATFGDERYDDGWRTDMGLVYITLGAPQQKANYHQGMSTRPVEIWFYLSPTPALPAYFNLVFYKRSEVDPYTLYSPRDDGPTKIVTNDLHDDAQALKVIDKSMGAEATHAMVSLIPGEPINIDHPSPTMASDLLLEAVRNLPEQKLEKERIARLRAANREVVTSSIFTGNHATELETVVLRDSRGLDTVHYLLRNERPDPTLIGTLKDKRAGYEMTLTTRVSTEAGKAVYERRDQLAAGGISAQAVESGRGKVFGAEGRLPLVPGNYVVEATLTNNLTHDSSRASSKVIVPVGQPNSLAISQLMLYRGNPVQNGREQIPFTLAGVRFSPRGTQSVEVHAGESLPLVYQLWLSPKDLQAGEKSKAVHVHYTLGIVGSMAGDSNRIEEDEDVPVANADTAGNLVSGRTLDTSKLQQGNYRLVIKATGPGSSRPAFSTMTIRIVPPEANVEMWTAYGDDRLHPVWQDDFLRGLAAEALNDNAEAAACFRRALAINPNDSEIQTHLSAMDRKLVPHTPGAL